MFKFWFGKNNKSYQSESKEQYEERVIQEEKNKTLAIINNFTDGLLLFDEKNRLSLINPKAEEFLGFGSRKIIGKSIFELSGNPVLELILEPLKPEIKSVFRKEIKVKENLTLEISTVPINREKKKIGTLAILHNITREKIIEKMKSEFVSITAHQLRTPLSAIKWTLRMLLDGDLGIINEEQKNFMEKVYRSNERMISLINDLLNVTRIEEGMIVYKPRLADIESIIQTVIDVFQDEINKKKLKIEFNKLNGKIPPVMVDVEKMKLAVQNLIDNAVKYTPSGGAISVSTGYNDRKIEVYVKDSGVGIPADQQHRVFTKFFRGANVIRMDTEGTGLGLFITKNIIEAHGGEIQFESKEGKGTTFYFTLPVKKEFAEYLTRKFY